MSANYYQAPRFEEQGHSEWWGLRVLGGAEVILGCAAAIAGCSASVQRDDSLPGVGILVSVVFGIFVLILPGCVLLFRVRYGFVGQLVPLLAGIFLLAWFV